MVILHVRDGEDGFLYDCSVESTIEGVTIAVVSIQNLRRKVRHLSLRLQEQFFEDSSPETWTDLKADLFRCASEAEAYASKEQVVHKRPLFLHILVERVQSLENKIAASPLIESSQVNLSQLLSGFLPLDWEETQLLWAGKQLMRGKRLCDYIGKNEKTKATVTLQSASSDAAQIFTSN
ncbi:uncharacterized protein LOC144713883 [Wolffia australiana]